MSGRDIIILGAGMAGLLAGNLFRALHDRVNVFEAQSQLPNNHSAVLRFRSPIVGDALGAPFRKVQVLKWAQPWHNPIADALAYARKCSGVIRSDRSIAGLNETVERWIAPDNLIASLAHPLAGDIHYGVDWKPDVRGKGPIISTIPMPALMRLLKYPPQLMPDFEASHGFNLIAKIVGADAFATVYVPDPQMMFNRVSMTGNTMVAEYACPDRSLDETEALMRSMAEEGQAMLAADLFGISPSLIGRVEFRMQRYAKILPVSDEQRKAFMFWASVKHNIYSLGRFATWRPGLLLDDIPKDVSRIAAWIASGNYDLMRHVL